MYVMNEFGFHDMDTLMENRGLIKLIHPHSITLLE